MARKPLGDQKMETRMEMRMPAEFEMRIDEWRRMQPRIPSRAEAIRRLAGIGLEVETSKASHAAA